MSKKGKKTVKQTPNNKTKTVRIYECVCVCIPELKSDKRRFRIIINGGWYDTNNSLAKWKQTMNDIPNKDDMVQYWGYIYKNWFKKYAIKPKGTDMKRGCFKTGLLLSCEVVQLLSLMNKITTFTIAAKAPNLMF
mmetsp:Transcript_26883/g.32731  ORF Transcript_26883/g.32731 Transcript_26883/m.32731 type:complete len:135 (-) Transcript_26883:132-536(-)